MPDGLILSWSYGVPLLAYESRRFDPELLLPSVGKVQSNKRVHTPSCIKDVAPGRKLERFYFSIEQSCLQMKHWVQKFTSGRTSNLVNEMCGQSEYARRLPSISTRTILRGALGCTTS